ncbi:DUF1071 domain-containing protein [Mammaliicoccus sp. F-M27]|uniref:Sak single strand annealing protein n=1 Tax=Mammaliicoccus sp. F-M27 TaxID=2898687 RepID=UPI001EFBCA06|nr:DUF1071 domain-containing protein [Mammaliicoccus sp. F-M27]
MTESLFNQLNEMNVNEHIEKKNGLSYLSWSWAHQQLKSVDPDYKIETHTFPHPDIANEQVFVPYLATPEGYFVQVSVTVKGKTETELLPVLDFKNKSLPKGSATTFDINKAHKRCFVKAAALHGLGLYIYNGEEMPESPKAKLEHIKDLQDKIKQAVEIGGDDASEQKVMQWLKITDYDSITEAQINPMIKQLNVLIDSKRGDN